MATISIRIDGALKRRLEAVVVANGTSVSQIVREALGTRSKKWKTI